MAKRKCSNYLALFLSFPLLFSAVFSTVTAGKAVAGNYSWTANGLSGKSIRTIAVSPNYAKDKTIFAVSDREDTKQTIYKSVNGGRSWSETGKDLSDETVSSIKLSPNYALDKTIFAVTTDALFKSTDGGASWNTGWQHDDWFVNNIVISPNFANDKTIFISAMTFNDVHDSGSLHRTASGGLFKSTDGGASWSPLKDLGAHLIDTVAVSPNYAKDKTIIAVFARAESAYQDSAVYKSTDGGASWSLVKVLPLILSLAVSPDYANDKTIFLGGESLYRSIDGGASWSAKKCGGY